MTLSSQRFAKFIGQNPVKQKLNFYIESFEMSGVLPPLFLIAQKGQGKTVFAEELARYLIPKDEIKAKTRITINCATLSNLKQFVDTIYFPYIQNKHATVFFDEFHKMPNDIQTAFLTVLNRDTTKTYLHSEEHGPLEFDLSKISFLFATTDPQQIISPLKDRLKHIHFNDYSVDELELIIKQKLPNIFIDKEALAAAASVCRGNARNASISMAQDNIFHYCARKQSNQFTMNDWKDMAKVLAIFPLGLEESEIQVLRALENVKGRSLANLAARTGFNTETIRREFENFLLKKDLITISKWRVLTEKGRRYLQDLAGVAN